MKPLERRLQKMEVRPDSRDITTWTDSDLLAVAIPDGDERRAFTEMPEAVQAEMLQALTELGLPR